MFSIHVVTEGLAKGIIDDSNAFRLHEAASQQKC